MNEKNTYLALSHCVVSSFLQKYIKKCCFSNSSHLIVCAIFFFRESKDTDKKFTENVRRVKLQNVTENDQPIVLKFSCLAMRQTNPIYCWWTSKYFVNFFSHPAFTALYRKCEKKYWHHSVFSPNVGKYGPEKTPYLDTFHAVNEWTNTVNLD